MRWAGSLHRDRPRSFVTGFDLRADHRHQNAAAAARKDGGAAAIVGAKVGLIGPDNQYSIATRLKWRTCQQRSDGIFQKLICRPKARAQVSAAVVHVIV